MNISYRNYDKNFVQALYGLDQKRKEKEVFSLVLDDLNV